MYSIVLALENKHNILHTRHHIVLTTKCRVYEKDSPLNVPHGTHIHRPASMGR